MRTARLPSGEKSFCCIWNCVAEIFFTFLPQKLTSASGEPLSTTSSKLPIGPDQLAAVLRM